MTDAEFDDVEHRGVMVRSRGHEAAVWRRELGAFYCSTCGATIQEPPLRPSDDAVRNWSDAAGDCASGNAVPPPDTKCLAWADGVHLFEGSYGEAPIEGHRRFGRPDRGYEVEKSCACGATVKRAA